MLKECNLSTRMRYVHGYVTQRVHVLRSAVLRLVTTPSVETALYTGGALYDMCAYDPIADPGSPGAPR
jgi:hypothetical protein